MKKSTSQIEKNVSASFGYVKKDMLMLNDAFSDMHDKIQHLSLNHAVLLGEVEKLRNEVSNITGKPVSARSTTGALSSGAKKTKKKAVRQSASSKLRSKGTSVRTKKK